MKFTDTLMVSIVIPTYNYAPYIETAINSILEQDYPENKMEIIVIDDGSTDNTKKILEPYILANKIRYYYQENKGKANATSRGICRAKGEIIFNLDADDFFLPGKIAATVEAFQQDNKIVHVASPARIEFTDGREPVTEPVNELLPNQLMVGRELIYFFYSNRILYGGGSTFAARSKVLKNIKIPTAVDMYIDEFLILATAMHGYSCFLPKPYSVWRVHGNNYSGNIQDPQKKRIKTLRLSGSADAVWEYIQDNQFEEEFKHLYALHYATRKIAFKEDLNEKSIKDILVYAYFIFFKGKYGWKIIKANRCFNRLLPMTVYNYLKNRY